MALTPGTRLGVYDVTTQIGAGGMGEVYRATDSNLKRSVAIKVLPASVAGDADRLARFQREAEVLAALNHPNIGAIYGLEKTPDFTALVMELVAGEDLSQRIARGAIPMDEALPLAKQIAEFVGAHPGATAVGPQEFRRQGDECAGRHARRQASDDDPQQRHHRD